MLLLIRHVFWLTVVKDMVVVTHVTAPDDFMVHLVRDQSVLTDVMKSLQTVGNSPDMKVNHFIEGEVYKLTSFQLHVCVRKYLHYLLCHDHLFDLDI